MSLEVYFEPKEQTIKSAEGKTIQLSDSDNKQLVSIKLNGETNQEGTPSPTNPSTIQNISGTIEINISNEDNTQSQTANFALSTGQKLYEGSYLSSNGIYNTRQQIVLDGSNDENWSRSGTNTSGQYRFTTAMLTSIIKKPASSDTVANITCSHFVKETANQTYSKNNGIAIHANGSIFIYNDSFKEYTTAQFKTWLSNNPITLEYELNTPETVSYTTEQQTAWNNITSMSTYRGTTNIESTAYAEIQYVQYGAYLIDEKYYTGLSNNFELFNENFKLGATPSNIYTLRIAKDGVVTQPNSVTLKDNSASFAELEIDNIEEEDYEYKYTLTDKMIDLDFYYDASAIFNNGATTLYNIAMDICSKANLVLGTTNFRGYDKAINWYDNTRTARDYIGYIAELNGGFARIENNTLYFKKQKTNSAKTINISDCENFKIGEYHKITRVIYELGTLKYEFGDETGNTLYLNPDNVYITTESEVEAIYNDIKDFEFYSFSTDNCPIDYDIKAGDIITFTDGVNTYPTIAQYELNYFGGWIGGYDLDINTERQEETQIIGNSEKIKNIQIIVDRQNNTITQVVTEVDEQNTKIAQTQQTVNELNTKIQDIADITTQAETIYASLDFTDINQSEPIEIKIHPTTTSISYIYPRDGLYPSDTLYMPNRILRFTNTDTNEVFDYELPDDLLLEPNSGTYDEFYLGYDQQICQVTKRCKYNADGSISLLADEVTTQYTYPIISLTDGDYTIELLGYNNGYMNIRLMASNIYTSQFATKAEVTSEISQTANEINLRVDEKLDEEDFTSANIMLKINNDTSSATIQADKINLNGAVTANQNFKIKTDGSMEAVNGLFTAGNVNLTDNGLGAYEGKLKILGNNFVNGLYSEGVVIRKPNSSTQSISANSIFLTMYQGEPTLTLTGTNGWNFSVRNNGISSYFENGLSFYVDGTNRDAGILNINMCYINGGVTTPRVIQTSREEDKKNFELLQNGLDIIKNTDIYKYNLKTQENGDKKHIGFVIGKDYKYAHEITAENEGEEVGVDTYSMISVAYKAIQEQQEIIEQLQKEIKELKGDDK